ncbi:hypothetical protein ILUMI_11500 [Ignelater luminosus]|uniref:PiggyBac transposable element-derived protein domain-containing protein n=1 Tax=Ignelater luminosus TaxID=2038154 RepID=A0A8K0GDW1_IGNLU|nr:hypothetical protein ILUMI_11500 [Ignelater luminosus]
MCSKRYLTDKELEEYLYDSDLYMDHINLDLQSSDSESDCETRVEKQVDANDGNLANSRKSLLEYEESSSADETDSDDDQDIVIPARNTRRRPRPLAKMDKPKSDMKAPSGTVWKKSPMMQKRRFAANVMKTASGLKQGIKPQTPLEAFRLFFNDIAIELILLYTNQKLQAIKNRETRSSFLQKSRNFQKEEILGFIGFLITAGAYKDNKDPVDEIFSEEGRKEHDNFAAIRELWNNVTDTFPKFLNPSESVVIDEELITFHGRCKFRVFIPTKPGKYGIEANVLCDSENYYCFAVEPYAGKCENQPKGYNSGPEVVKRLVTLAKIENSGRNITMDRKFTSLATTAELFEKKLTVVGTIASTRRDVPLELRPQSLNKSLPGRKKFLKSLGKELCKINMENRSRYKGLNKSYAAILRIFGYNCQQGEAITRGSVIKEPEGPATRAAIKKIT